jgi:hypothetical protein
MSNKKKNIILVNLLSEQRYLNNKFLVEAEEPGIPQPQKPAIQSAPQETQLSLDMLTTQDLKNQGVNTTDIQTHTSILQQLQPYSDKVNLDSLQPHVGKDSFFDELNKHMNLTHKFDNLSKNLSGEEVKLSLPGGIKLQGTFGVKDNQVQGLKDVGIGTKAYIGSTPVNFNVKYKNPTAGSFNVSNVQVGATIPIGNSGGHNKKSHGNML